MNHNFVRSVTAFGAFAALVASSSATITFPTLAADDKNIAYGEVAVSDPQLGPTTGILKGEIGTLAHPKYLTDTFTVKISNAELISASVDEVTSLVTDGFLGMTVTLTNNSVSDTIYASTANSTVPGVPFGKKLANSNDDMVNLAAGTYTVTTTVEYYGRSTNTKTADGYIQTFNVLFKEQPVPEPASFGVVGVGLIGLAVRRKKGGK